MMRPLCLDRRLSRQFMLGFLLALGWALSSANGSHAQSMRTILPHPPTQAIQTHTQVIARADSLYWTRHYLAAAQQYEAVLRRPIVKPLAWEWYEAARTQALSKQPQKALASLQALLSYAPSARWRSEPDFTSLQRFPQWQELVRRADAQAAKQPVHNKPLADSLAVLLQEDQAVRQQRGALTAMQAKHLFAQDSLHLIRLRQLVAHYGWLGRDEVGPDGNRALVLLLLHVDKAAVLREFLPAVERSVQQGQTEALSLAYLQDRLAIREGRPQLYGTQFQQNEQTQQLEVAPVASPEQVDIRRYGVGLPPLATYVRSSTRERPTP